jgi:arylsulfatase A
VRNGEDVGEIEGYSCQIVVDEAINWLRSKETPNPFYLQVCFHEPHEPVASPTDLVQKYLPFSKNGDEAQYFANVENIDKALGRLMEFLNQNHNENTLIIFSSDNGPETLNRYARAKRSYGSPGELKGMKLWTTEAGFRVPGIMYWMGKPTFNGTSDAVVSSLDFMPTFAELSGAALPERTLDGESIILLIQTGKKERTKPLLWGFYNALNEHVVAMRTDDWKIMCRLKNDTTYLSRINNLYEANEAFVKEAELCDFVLYNMKEDISESKDVSEQYPKIFEKLKRQLTSEYSELLDDSFIWQRIEE